MSLSGLVNQKKKKKEKELNILCVKRKHHRVLCIFCLCLSIIYPAGSQCSPYKINH